MAGAVLRGTRPTERRLLMFLRAMSPSTVRPLLAGVGAIAMVACGSEVAPVFAPESAVVQSSTDHGGVTGLANVSVGACELVGPSGFTLTLSGRSSAAPSGNETLTCLGTVTPAPSRTQFFSALPCYLPVTGDWTSNSELILRSNGGASLRCQAR
jgi:hypothetical protein